MHGACLQCTLDVGFRHISDFKLASAPSQHSGDTLYVGFRHISDFRLAPAPSQHSGATLDKTSLSADAVTGSSSDICLNLTYIPKHVAKMWR